MNRSMTVAITGATGAIGKAIAIRVASLNINTIIIARNKFKAERTIVEISQTTGNMNVKYELADLSINADIHALAARWKDPLHVLINNAAVTPRDRKETSEGIECQFATNVLGYFRMTQAFIEILKTSAPSRIIDVASYWAGGLDLDDLEFKRRPYHNGTAYRQSKQANRMLAAAWAKRLSKHQITINSCHPGDVNSTLSNNLGFGGAQSPEQGAETPVWLAIDEKVADISGKYFEFKKESKCSFSTDGNAVEALFQACLAYNKH